MRQCVERSLGEEQAEPGRNTIDRLFAVRQVLDADAENN